MISPKNYFSLEGFAHSTLWSDVDPVWVALHKLSDYFKACTFSIDIDVPKNIYLMNPETISIGEGTVIEPGVCIQGPCILGKDCRISHGAYLRGGVICGDGCVIGHSAEVKRSILLNKAHATHFTYVGDSILGQGVNLGAGVKCANLRLDREEIVVLVDGIRIGTGLVKMGAIVGDGTQIGCNSVINPGTLIGKGCLAYPLILISGTIPAGKRLMKNRQDMFQKVGNEK